MKQLVKKYPSLNKQIMKLKLRKRRYYCNLCKKYIVRVNDVKSFISFCDTADKDSRLIYKPTK